MPAAVAARPRDARGYPIPAITPWEDGQPLFASLSSIRTLICLVERRCSVCGLPMKRGPVWRVVHDDMADTIAQALETGLPWINLAPAHEGPGHRACMLYSAILCPHLASPNARRTQDARASKTTLPKGLARGETAGVAGFKDYSYQMTNQGQEIQFGQPVELIAYTDGSELLDALAEELAKPQAALRPSPPYLLDDDQAARNALVRLLQSPPGRRDHADRSEKARKQRRKSGQASRRKNR
ncbi:hypothetical protein [Catenulispora sp. GP43]|uniref:hypothetical protein n=1 Tax=Catenulispora sp. GP43 TaxID=3156263 RepID=UPI003517466C